MPESHTIPKYCCSLVGRKSHFLAKMNWPHKNETKHCLVCSLSGRQPLLARSKPVCGLNIASASRTIGHDSASGQGGTLAVIQPSAHAISCLEPTAQLLLDSRNTRERSRTTPAPKGPAMKQDTR